MTYAAYKGGEFKFNFDGADSDGDALDKAKRIDPEVTHVMLVSETDRDEKAGSGRCG